MASKTVLIDAERTPYPRRPQDTERIRTRGGSAKGLPASTPGTVPGDQRGCLAALGYYAIERLTHWIASYSVVLLRLSLGGIFFWFGLLKFFPALSPAEALAMRTLDTLTWGYLAPHLALPAVSPLGNRDRSGVAPGGVPVSDVGAPVPAHGGHAHTPRPVPAWTCLPISPMRPRSKRNTSSRTSC